jgi:hypothetical protein
MKSTTRRNPGTEKPVRQPEKDQRRPNNKENSDLTNKPKQMNPKKISRTAFQQRPVTQLQETKRPPTVLSKHPSPRDLKATQLSGLLLECAEHQNRLESSQQ